MWIILLAQGTDIFEIVLSIIQSKPQRSNPLTTLLYIYLKTICAHFKKVVQIKEMDRWNINDSRSKKGTDGK